MSTATQSVAAAASWIDGYVPLASVIGGFATGLAAGLAIAGLAAGVWQVRRSAAMSREINAYETYDEYLRLCIDHPELSSSDLAMKHLGRADFNEIADELSVESERYLWFISFMLNACEKILTIRPGDKGWRTVIEDQISYHKAVLRELWGNQWERHYSSDMDRLVQGVLGKGDPIHAEIELANATQDDLLPVMEMARVDSGALHLCLPDHVAKRLRLPELERREVTLSNGQNQMVPYAGPVRVRFRNRQCFVGALVIGDEPLLGMIPMEDMGVQIHPGRRELIVNPDSANIPTSVATGLRLDRNVSSDAQVRPIREAGGRE